MAQSRQQQNPFARKYSCTMLLDELKRFNRVRFTTEPSAKDFRYTLDYIM